jgi:hypothetical protein
LAIRRADTFFFVWLPFVLGRNFAVHRRPVATAFAVKTLVAVLFFKR